MTLPNYDEGETLCGENSCRKLLRDMEGATCFDCGAAPRYCANHIVTSPCGATQCLICNTDGGGCTCHVCVKSAKEQEVEARYDA